MNTIQNNLSNIAKQHNNIMTRLYFKIRFVPTEEVYEIYDPHSSKVIAKGEELAFLKTPHTIDGGVAYHPLTEQDLKELADKGIFVFVICDEKSNPEKIAGKVVLDFNGDEYLKTVILTRP